MTRSSGVRNHAVVGESGKNNLIAARLSYCVLGNNHVSAAVVPEDN